MNDLTPDPDPVETTSVASDILLRGLALEWIRALLTTIDVGLVIFADPLRTMKLDDDLRFVRKVLDREAGKG